MEGIPNNKYIILFDGVCFFCNNSVQYIIKNDKKDLFRFVSLQSDLGTKILKHLGIDNKNIDSIVLYIPQRAYYYKSDAIFHIAKKLNNWFSILFIFSLFPRFFRDWIYDFVAKNRYNWFGKMESCMIPSPEIQSKFL